MFWFGVLWYICVELRFLVFDCGYLRLGGLYYGYYLGVAIVVALDWLIVLLRYDYCLFIMVVVRSLLFNWLATFCCYLILGFWCLLLL